MYFMWLVQFDDLPASFVEPAREPLAQFRPCGLRKCVEQRCGLVRGGDPVAASADGR
jgi:hypothetical protein